MDGPLFGALLDPPGPTAITPGAGPGADDDNDLRRITNGTLLHGDLPRVLLDSWGVRDGAKCHQSVSRREPLAGLASTGTLSRGRPLQRARIGRRAGAKEVASRPGGPGEGQDFEAIFR